MNGTQILQANGGENERPIMLQHIFPRELDGGGANGERVRNVDEFLTYCPIPRRRLAYMQLIRVLDLV